jgi:hypothetical protein
MPLPLVRDRDGKAGIDRDREPSRAQPRVRGDRRWYQEREGG